MSRDQFSSQTTPDADVQFHLANVFYTYYHLQPLRLSRVWLLLTHRHDSRNLEAIEKFQIIIVIKEIVASKYKTEIYKSFFYNFLFNYNDRINK